MMKVSEQMLGELLENAKAGMGKRAPEGETPGDWTMGRRLTLSLGTGRGCVLPFELERYHITCVCPPSKVNAAKGTDGIGTDIKLNY